MVTQKHPTNCRESMATQYDEQTRKYFIKILMSTVSVSHLKYGGLTVRETSFNQRLNTLLY